MHAASLALQARVADAAAAGPGRTGGRRRQACASLASSLLWEEAEAEEGAVAAHALLNVRLAAAPVNATAVRGGGRGCSHGGGRVAHVHTAEGELEQPEPPAVRTLAF